MLSMLPHTPSDVPMTASSYELPPPIYLPSSGGYTSSRFTEDPLHQRVFPFRRYSVDEDGRLVCRTRSTNHESRPKPYDRPQKVPDSAPPPGVGWPPAPRGHPPPKQVDSSTFAGLFQQLIPIAVNEPVAFESKASAICASFDLDPTTSEDIINSVKQQFPAVRNQDTTVSPPSSGPTNIELAANPAPASAPTPPNTLPPPPTTLETPLVPVKQRRQFSCGSPAYTIWYFTASAQSLTFPPQEVTPMVGDLYIHHNRLEDIYQVWLYGIDLAWKSVTDVEKVYHPTIDDRVLSMRANGTPNWITTASFTTIRGRKCKRVQVD